MPEKQIQDYLFQRIKELLPAGVSLADTISEVLHVSQDSAYRRIRGETPLVLEEAFELCRNFQISLDQLLHIADKSVAFQNVEFDTENGGFKGYLEGILQRIKQLDSFNEKSIIYMSKDLPIFIQFCSHAVFAFHYFFWMKTIFQHPDYVQRKFSFDCLTPDIEAIGKELLSIYCKIPSVELWNTESINSLLLQINYYYETGTMTREQVDEVYAGLKNILAHLQLQAEYGRKFMPGENPHNKKDNFQLFFNRVGLGDNTILTLFDGRKALYLNYDALNYVMTIDETFCHQVHQKLQTIMRRSTLISSGSERQRQHFFNVLNAKMPITAIKKRKLAS